MANFVDTNITKSYDFQKYSKPIEDFLLFLQWQMDLYCLDDALQNEYNRFLQQLYYIKLSEYLTAGRIYLSDILTKQMLNDSTDFTDISHFQQDLLDNLSDEEFQYIQYRRNSSAHISLDGYNLFDNQGKKIAETKTYSKESLTKVQVKKEQVSDNIDNILKRFNCDERQLDITITQKLHNLFIQHKKAIQYWINIFITYYQKQNNQYRKENKDK